MQSVKLGLGDLFTVQTC